MASIGKTRENGLPALDNEKNSKEGINHCIDEKDRVHKVKIKIVV